MVKQRFLPKEVWLISDSTTVVNFGRIVKFFVACPQRTGTHGIYVKLGEEHSPVRICTTVGYHEGIRGIRHILNLVQSGEYMYIVVGSRAFWNEVASMRSLLEDHCENEDEDETGSFEGKLDGTLDEVGDMAYSGEGHDTIGEIQDELGSMHSGEPGFFDHKE